MAPTRSVASRSTRRIPLPPHEHDDDDVSPFRPSHVHEPWPYVCASRRSRPCPYVHIRGRIFFLAPWPLYVRVHATCAPLLRHVRASTSTGVYVHIRDHNDNATYASTRWVPTVRHFLACEDVAGGSQQSGGNFFREIRWPVRWVPAVRWSNNYCARNKVALPCCGRGPSCQPLHVQYSSDGSRSLPC